MTERYDEAEARHQWFATHRPDYRGHIHTDELVIPQEQSHDPSNDIKRLRQLQKDLEELQRQGRLPRAFTQGDS